MSDRRRTDRASVHGELDAGARARAARRDRCRRTSRSCSRRSRPRTACAGELDLPPALVSEVALRRHLLELLGRNESCERNLSFLGGGCWQHHVPAVCDEIVAAQRVPDAGLGHAVVRSRAQPGLVRVHEPARRADRHGLRRPARLQLGLRRRPRDPHGGAADRPPRGARRRLDRPRAPRRDPHLLRAARDARPHRRSSSSATTRDGRRRRRRPRAPALRTHRRGLLREPVVPRRASRPRAAEIARSRAHARRRDDRRRRPDLARRARAARATTAPTSWSARCSRSACTCTCGGGAGGFIATRDEERYAREYPTLILSISRRRSPGERGFGIALFEQTSYGAREEGNDWTGNSVYLWAVANAVYMSLLGPEGFAELGAADPRAQPLRGAAARRGRRACGSSSRRASSRSSSWTSTAPAGPSPRSTASLRERGIFGGRDLSRDLPELGQSALYCVTEVHTQADIDRLAARSARSSA